MNDLILQLLKITQLDEQLLYLTKMIGDRKLRTIVLESFHRSTYVFMFRKLTQNEISS